MITFLITPVKSKRDSILFETPTQRLTFDVAETPVLFDSLSVNQLKQLQASSRESLCGIEAPFKRQSICTVNSCIDPYINSLDFGNNLETLQFETECGLTDLTPANVFNAIINHNNNNNNNNNIINYEHDNGEYASNCNHNHNTEHDHININNTNDNIVTSTRYNDEFCITMLITKQKLSQQKINQYLIANNNNLKLRNINIIQSCECIPCQQRNWNMVDIRWEKLWKIQQFQFSIIEQQSQLNTVNCDNITNILTSNGVLQQELYINAQKTFYRKLVRKGIPPNSNKQISRKNRKRLNGLNNNNKAKDKKIILQHLATWSSSNCINYNYNDNKKQHVEHKYNYDYNSINDDTYEYLPVISKEDNGCSYISCDTLMGLLDGSLDYSHLFDYFVIIDCRYEYEYNGGHINGAMNISDKLLTELMFKANIAIKNIKIAWIFHCEYSKNRGPQTCKYFRKLDREINEYRYPHVSFPHVYVLQGGYKKFWGRYKNLYSTIKNQIFKPFGYISMWNDVFDDKRFIYSQFRQNAWKKEKKKQKAKIRH